MALGWRKKPNDVHDDALMAELTDATLARAVEYLRDSSSPSNPSPVPGSGVLAGPSGPSIAQQMVQALLYGTIGPQIPAGSKPSLGLQPPIGVTAQGDIYSAAPTPVDIDTIPLETEVVRGWRTYTMTADGTLKGSRTSWPTAEMVAECSEPWSPQQIPPQELAQQHLASGNCGIGSVANGCGIYSHKTGPEYLQFERMTHYKSPAYQPDPPAVKVVAQCISTGIVVEHKMGYRAEKCRIEQMWLIVPRPCPDKHPIWIPPACAFWVCETNPAVDRDVPWAEVLSKKYQVPCVAMPVTEFFMKLDEGSL